MSISRGGDYRTDKPTSIGIPEAVQSWPFKEPEKKSAWKDSELKQEEPAGARFMVDTEGEKAAKRTAMIKARMSPPGALNLPPLLEAMRLKYGITDGFFDSQASFDRIFVFPIDLVETEQVAEGSAILRPQLKKLKDLQEGNRGVLISAGLSAADTLMSHGIELGHIVTTNKNVPFARRCDRLSDGTDLFYLVMRDADLAGSETLAAELRAGQKRIEDVGGEDAYSHQLARNDNGEWTWRKKKSAYIADTW